MFFVVKLGLAVLRTVSHTVLFVEAQRLALHLIRPTSSGHVARLEDALLQTVQTPVEHLFVPTPLPMHALLAGDSSAPPIVLLHGHSMSGAFYYRNVDDLVSLGYRVYSLDLLGWGRSARPRFQGTTSDDTVDWYVNSVAAWVDAVLGNEPFSLMGHSLGAYIAFEVAKRFPQRVHRLIMISPAAITRDVPLVRALYFALPPQSIVRRGGLLGFLLFMWYYPRSDAYVRDKLRELTYHLAALSPPSGEEAVVPIINVSFGVGRRTPMHKLQSSGFGGGGGGGRILPMASCTRPLVESLDLLPIPVQLVCGETDASINVEDVHMLHREMKRRGFDVQLVVVEGTDHCPHLEAPEDFFHSIAYFARMDNKCRREQRQIAAWHQTSMGSPVGKFRACG